MFKTTSYAEYILISNYIIKKSTYSVMTHKWYLESILKLKYANNYYEIIPTYNKSDILIFQRKDHLSQNNYEKQFPDTIQICSYKLKIGYSIGLRKILNQNLNGGLI